MPWLRIGDTFTTSPHYLRLYELSDVDTLTRKASIAFLVECASMAAQHMSDYIVRYGTAVRVGEDMAGLLLEVCVRAGLMEEVEIDGERVWKIIDDPEFIHMRTREEVEWERQRKSDNSNPELIVPVRLRDGDACRYCGQVVNWRARKGRHRGTYDHREPGKSATVATLVVACQGCNASRDRDPLADQRHPLLPAPRDPYYSPHTREWITEHDWAKANGYSITSRRGRTIPPGTVPDDRQQVVTTTQASAATTPAADEPDPANQAGPDQSATPAPGRDTAATQRATPAPSGDTAATTSARPTHQVDTAAPATPAAGRDTDTSARPGRRPDTAATTPARPAPADTAAPARTDTQSVIAANRATPAPSRDTAHPARPAPTPDLANRPDPADRQSPGSGNPGSGTGRDGSARFGSQVRASAPDPKRDRSSSSSRGRRARRRGRRSSRRDSL